jgi:hypothetical protein
MGGAFVAVADDATCSWWNPAGLAASSFLSATLERSVTDDLRQASPSGPARRDGASGFAVSYPALALSYYRLRVSEIAPILPTADELAGRQDQEPARVALHTLALSQFGITVGQSLGEHLVLASTVKLVRAGSASSSQNAGASAGDRLSAAGDLDTESESKTDLDVGAMVSYGAVRLGIAVKHVFEPEFDDASQGLELKRQVRAGVAWLSGELGPLNGLTAALDVDVTRTPTVGGDVRHLAAGLEAWMAGRRIGLRSGLSVDTAGPVNTTGSVGGTFGGWYGLFLNGALMFGSDDARNGWSTSLSVTF